MGDAFCNGDHFGDINRAIEALGMSKIDWLPTVGWNAAAHHDEQETARLGDFIEKTRDLHKQYLERLQGVSLGRVTTREPTLEDAYVALVTEQPVAADG